MEKYFCHSCLNSFYISHEEHRRVEGQPQCPECGQLGRFSEIEYKGGVYPHIYEVTRTWHVEAYHQQDALDKTKNWNHDSLSVKRLSTKEPFYE